MEQSRFQLWNQFGLYLEMLFQFSVWLKLIIDRVLINLGNFFQNRKKTLERLLKISEEIITNIVKTGLQGFAKWKWKITSSFNEINIAVICETADWKKAIVKRLNRPSGRFRLERCTCGSYRPNELILNLLIDRKKKKKKEKKEKREGREREREWKTAYEWTKASKVNGIPSPFSLFLIAHVCISGTRFLRNRESSDHFSPFNEIADKRELEKRFVKRSVIHELARKLKNIVRSCRFCFCRILILFEECFSFSWILTKKKPSWKIYLSNHYEECSWSLLLTSYLEESFLLSFVSLLNLEQSFFLFFITLLCRYYAHSLRTFLPILFLNLEEYSQLPRRTFFSNLDEEQSWRIFLWISDREYFSKSLGGRLPFFPSHTTTYYARYYYAIVITESWKESCVTISGAR